MTVDASLGIEWVCFNLLCKDSRECLTFELRGRAGRLRGVGVVMTKGCARGALDNGLR